MANCTINQRNYASSPADMMHGLANLIYDGSEWVQNKSNNLLDIIENTHVDTHQRFVENNNKYMKRLMEINLNQREHILNNLGKNAHMNGSSDVYTSEVLKPSYVEGNNYLEFAQKVQSEEARGNITTRTNNWQGYGETANLYPDELAAFSRGTDVSQIYSIGSGAAAGYASTSESSFNVWNVGCESNSILYKTKKLYNERKINSIVARFGTGADMVTPITYNGQIATQYGESRGRNLLTKEAENSFKGGYNINGYKNPYCRVWTHHYKYDSIYKTMRPFSYIDTQDGRGGYKETTTLKNINTWTHFKEVDENNNPINGGWRNSNSGYDKSVMGKGMINFAPMFNTDDSKKIHTKQCMFSIENLAWKDFDPYNFENCLSWEQRGPNGGRIMWFPPYGLTFNESTQARWNAHSFIGRGEEVYTYQDTVRSGTLSFLMVVDHPSIIDYVLGQHNAKNQVTDNDIHRYFAGCDKDTLVDVAKPTPMTDEYTHYITYGDDPTQEIEKEKNETPPTPIPPSVNINKITVSCYFPNNYSGYYDNNTFQNENNVVSSMKYLLMGCYGGIIHTEEGGEDNKIWAAFTNSCLKIDEELFDEGFENYCIGYAMGNSYENISMSDEEEAKDYFLIIQQSPRFLLNNNSTMKGVKDSGWLYRIDYDPNFDWPRGDDRYRNTIDQVPVNGKKIREITQTYSLNAESLQSEIETETNVSFLQFCCGIMEVTGKQTKLLEYLKERYEKYVSEDNDIYKSYVEVLKSIQNGTTKIKAIKSIGYSSKRQGETKQGQKRNELLAKQRAEMLQNLFLDSGFCPEPITIEVKEIPSNGTLNSDENGEEETRNRRAELIIELETESIEEVPSTQETSSSTETANVETTVTQYVGYTQTDRKVEINGRSYYLYQENDKQPLRYWYNVDDWIGKSDNGKKQEPSAHKWRLYDEEIITSGVYAGSKIQNRDNEENRIRYDQEYYFFKKLEAHDKIVYKKLVDKLQYFDPAFHSMTPEGFNGRLTFLNQCMRQGNTLASVENNSTQSTARNLAFGRPPFCVLRLGDFYNQMIIIDNLSINYDFDGGVQWDLNAEGIGVQPLLAQVSLSIKFVGGADMSGPIRRLQNAMTFNYYANTSLYDNRTDRIEYNVDDKTNQNVSVTSSHVYDASSEAAITYRKIND